MNNPILSKRTQKIHIPEGLQEEVESQMGCVAQLVKGAAIKVNQIEIKGEATKIERFDRYVYTFLLVSEDTYVSAKMAFAWQTDESFISGVKKFKVVRGNYKISDAQSAVEETLKEIYENL